MKKDYISPLVKQGAMENETLLVGSGVSGGGMGYGGVDNGGNKEPAAKSYSVWDE